MLSGIKLLTVRIPIKYVGSPHKWLPFKSYEKNNPSLLIRNSLSHEEFTDAISLIKFGHTFKTTNSNRFDSSIKLIRRIFEDTQVTVLDVGASDGSTSLEIFNNLNISKYYLTDLNLKLYIFESKKLNLFFDENREIICGANDFVIFFYSIDPTNLLSKLVNSLLRISNNAENFSLSKEIILINPQLNRIMSSNIEIVRHDGLNEWKGERVNLVVLGNLLNDSYFDTNSKLTFLRNAFYSLKSDGILLLGENRNGIENTSIFRKVDKGFRLIQKINEGASAEKLASSIVVN